MLLALFATFIVLAPIAISADVVITVPEGSAISLPYPPGTVLVELGANGGMITLAGVDLINAPPWSTVTRRPDGSVSVVVGSFTVAAPAGSAISTPAPAGTLRVDIGTVGGTINVNGTNLATASAGATVVFNTNNTTTITVPSGGGTSVTMPTTNGPTVTDNGSTITVLLPGEAAVTIPANGGSWYAVFFNSNGGNHVAAQIIEGGTAIAMPATPMQAGFVFAEWHSDAALTTVWNFGTNTVVGITTLYASWGLAVVEPPPPIVEEPDEPEEQPPVVTPPVAEEVPPVEDEPVEVLPPVVDTDEPPAEEEPPADAPEVSLPPPPPPPIDPVQEDDAQPTEPDEPYEPDQSVDTEATADETADDNTEIDIIDAADEYPETPPQDEDLPDTDSTDEDSPDEDLPTENAVDEYDEYIEAEQITVTFTFSNFDNPVNDSVSHYRIVNRIQGLEFLYGNIPAFTNGGVLVYSVLYRTNLNNSQRVMAGNVNAGSAFVLLPPQLMPGEIITEISIALDTIPPGFGVGNTIAYSFVQLYDGAANYWEVTYGEQSIRSFIIAALMYYTDNISGLEGRYDSHSWNTLQAVVAYANAVLANPYSTIEELEAAYVHLQQAIAGLIPVVQTASRFTAASVARAVAMSLLFLVLIVLLAGLLRHRKRAVVHNAA